MSIDNLSQLKALKLFGMATALAEIRAETPRLTLTPDGCLNHAYPVATGWLLPAQPNVFPKIPIH